jgi:hypothetical protein
MADETRAPGQQQQSDLLHGLQRPGSRQQNAANPARQEERGLQKGYGVMSKWGGTFSSLGTILIGFSVDTHHYGFAAWCFCVFLLYLSERICEEIRSLRHE